MKNIFLIGMPSSGKSTLGRQLAKYLDFQFIDMDDLIVNQYYYYNNTTVGLT